MGVCFIHYHKRQFFMKKTMIIMAFFLFATIIKTSAQGSLVIYNNTCETLSITLYAEDTNAGHGCGSWISYALSVPSLGSVSTNTPAWINDPTLSCSYDGGSVYSVGWATHPVPAVLCYEHTSTPGSPTYGWDGAVIASPSAGASIAVGNSGGCVGSPTNNLTGVLCVPEPVGGYMYAVWDESTTTLTIHN